MAKPASEYKFTHKHIAQLMLKELEIHEGLWQVSVNFMMAGGNFGPSDDDLFPSAVVGVQSYSLNKADTAGPLVFDASELNPK